MSKANRHLPEIHIPHQNHTASTYILYFDGSEQSKKGGAGCCLFEDGKLLWTQSNYLGGCVTSNQAEYLGLIYGLWEVNRHPLPENLIIRGDSELVINQTIGKFLTKNSRLVPLMMQVVALVEEIRDMGVKVEFERVARKENELADREAKKGTEKEEQEKWVLYYPNLNAGLEVEIQGRRTVASNDMGACYHGPTLIDADFFFSLPIAPKYLPLKPSNITIVHSKGIFLPVMGLLKDFSFSIPVTTQGGGQDIFRYYYQEILVVFSLPVPFHITGLLKNVDIIAEYRLGTVVVWKSNSKKKGAQKEFKLRDALPEPYASHPYYFSQVVQLGEYS